MEQAHKESLWREEEEKEAKEKERSSKLLFGATPRRLETSFFYPFKAGCKTTRHNAITIKRYRRIVRVNRVYAGTRARLWP